MDISKLSTKSVTSTRRKRSNNAAAQYVVNDRKIEASHTAQIKQEKIDEAKDPVKQLAKTDKKLEAVEKHTAKLMAKHEKTVSKVLKEKTTPVAEKVETRGRKKIDKTPTWNRYYSMRRIPRAILDILKDRLTYDQHLDAFTVTIKGSELLEELQEQYPKITNTTINTSFYRLKDAGWFQEVSSYTGPDSDRTVRLDPTLIMTPSELRTLKQDH